MRSLLRAAVPSAASALCAYLLFRSLTSGSSPTISLSSSVLGIRHSAAAEPSQFWFMQMLFFAGAVGFGYMAWRDYTR